MLKSFVKLHKLCTVLSSVVKLFFNIVKLFSKKALRVPHGAVLDMRCRPTATDALQPTQPTGAATRGIATRRPVQRCCNPGRGRSSPRCSVLGLAPASKARKTWHNMARATDLGENRGRVPVIEVHELGCHCGRSNRSKVIATGNAVMPLMACV